MKYFNKIKSFLSNINLSDVAAPVIGGTILLGVAYGNTLAEVAYVVVSLIATVSMVFLSVLMLKGEYSSEVAKQRKDIILSRKNLTGTVVMFFVTFYLVNTGGAYLTALSFILTYSSTLMLHISTCIAAKGAKDDTAGSDYQGE